MKAIITAIAAAGLFSMTACNTTALREKEAELATKQHTIDSMNIAIAKKQAIDSMSEVTRYQYTIAQPVAPVVPAANYASYAYATTPRYAAPRRAARRSYSSVRRASTRHYAAYSQPATTYSAPAAPSTVYQQPVQQRKRGWSAKAKGAVIGAGTGAAAGAIINGRNRLAGAIIGGVLGAGAGTGIGAILDHKNGR